MTDTYRAQLVSNQPDNPGWRLFVMVPGRVADWPEAAWSTGNPPTIQQRGVALEDMGFQYATGAPEWDWCETQPWEDDPHAVVKLCSVAHVRPLED
ncbi:DUF6303 family protein [Kitasatospora sp. NPDC053057]|uniref:DUF6303 family protein n=1 Tax=Kitasatospora sp. NPDC053057 TaxID=3364062 RepID=UPI0037CB2E1C